MASYSVFIKPSAVREIEKIASVKDRRRVVAAIRALSRDPRPPGTEKLTGQNRYRARLGRYRLVYSVDDAARSTLIVKVGDRRDVYR